MSEARAAAAAAALAATMEERRQHVDAGLRRYLGRSRAPQVDAAVEHSLFAPGKRLRPVLAWLVADAFGVEARRVLPAAVAVEMVHTASLILDDLPCMDAATLRRGRPACHAVFGEATAVLAAFALLNRANQILADGWPGGPRSSVLRLLARELGAAVDGMIAGQAADLAKLSPGASLPRLEFIHSRKTGDLFVASARIGARLGAASPEDLAALTAFAENVGRAFQALDDVTDAEGDRHSAGKDVGQDHGKATLVSLAGAEATKRYASDSLAASAASLTRFGPAANALRALAVYLARRVAGVPAEEPRRVQ